MKNKKITNLTICKNSIKESHLKYYRLSLLIIGILILISGIFYKYLSKDLYDPFYIRVLLTIPIIIVYATSYASKFVKNNFNLFFNGCLTLIIFWSLFIASKNDYSFITTIIFLFVASITPAAVDKARFIPLYSSLIISITISYLLISGIENAIGFTIILTVLLSHFVTYLILKSKEEIEKSLIESENRIRYLVEALGEGIGIIGIDDIFIFTNPSANELFEVEANDLIGQPFGKFLSTTNNEIFAQRARVNNANVSNTYELMIITSQQKSKTLLITETYYNFGQQDFHGSILVFRDISLRIKAEKELEKAKNKAEESDRLKSAFLANMSHEIRTPMNSILGFADLLMIPELSGEEQQNYIQIIQKSGIRMLNIINDIIDISKVEAGLMEIKIEDTNINEQFEYLYNFFKHEVETKGINFSLNMALPDNKANIKTDTIKFHAILVNLVKNAIKYTHQGSIEIGYIYPSENGQNDCITFYVKDSGIGVPMCRQSAIFERFVQADIEDRHAYQGAGLGLSIGKAYVDLLGGTIGIKSEEGVGSTFFFKLPYNSEVTQNENFKVTHYIEKADENLSISGLKILIVEDDHFSEMLLTNIVNEANNTLIKVIDGSEAVEICQKNPDIDLILMDIRMSNLNGYDATKQIRSFNKDVVIIAQTAFGLSGDREKAIKAGCNDYISKPINSDELLAIIKKHLNL